MGSVYRGFLLEGLDYLPNWSPVTEQSVRWNEHMNKQQAQSQATAFRMN